MRVQAVLTCIEGQATRAPVQTPLVLVDVVDVDAQNRKQLRPRKMSSQRRQMRARMMSSDGCRATTVVVVRRRHYVHG
jgi:hypothetical protein